MNSRSRLPVVALLLCAGLPLGAQSAVATSSRSPQALTAPATPHVTAVAAQAMRPPRGPTTDNATAGIRPAAPAPTPQPAPRRADTTQNRSLMIVGGVALVVGALIGDKAGTIIMVGGAGVGLYGLYKFLQ